MEPVIQIARELGIKKEAVEASIALFDDGNTVPFVARYRKEQTGGLDDEVLRNIEERLQYLRQLEKKKETVLLQLKDLNVQVEGLFEKIGAATTLVEVEDYYRPYRPKRKTRASEAIRRGLGPLADEMMEVMTGDKTLICQSYVNPKKEVADPAMALAGAMDILAERFTDDPSIRLQARRWCLNQGRVETASAKKEMAADERSAYEMYYDFEEKISDLAAHRVLAINRGEKEGFLEVRLSLPDLAIMEAILKKNLSHKVLFLVEIKESILDGYKRLLRPSLERDVRNNLTEKGQTQAIHVFTANVSRLLLQRPVKNTPIIGYDPAFRTGCKLACVDAAGNLLETGVIYPVEPHNQVEKSKEILVRMIKSHNIKAISLGNGTACRENEAFLESLIDELKTELVYTITNEAGASVYSASKRAQKEFPDLDVTLRSAVSIARRLIDPLAELVKIEPKAIGVGQYQHDIDQKKLSHALDAVVEDCVNKVGVDLNTASEPLLIQVSGLTKTTARNIVAHRTANGAFKTRQDLRAVKGIGPKAFEQAAGFLRIPSAEDPLDNTGVHPEAYEATRRLLKDNQARPGDEASLRSIDIEENSAKLNLGIHTLKDIIDELLKPGRDPREDLPKPVFKRGIIDLKDLQEGMTLKGVVRNVVDFGAFVDIGVHQDGLVHISELSDEYVKSALEQVQVGQQVDVRIIGIDQERERIALSMKGFIDE